MSGGCCTVRLLLIVACALATFAHCARPLEDDELGAVILRLLETSREIPANHFAPPQLPSGLHGGKSLKVNRQPPATAKEDEVKSKPMYDDKSNEESSRVRPSVEVEASDDDHDQELQRPKWMRNYFSMLHLTPSGANPIGNHGRPPTHASTTHVATKYPYPPQDHRVESMTMDDGKSNRKRSKANPNAGASAADPDQEMQRPKWMHNYFNMLHLTPSGANPTGNQGQSPHATTTHVSTKYRYPPQDHRVKTRTTDNGKGSKASPSVGVDANADDHPLQRPKDMYNYNSMLYKTPSGPNPIGNNYGSASTTHNMKNYNYPPPKHRVQSGAIYDDKSSRESDKATPSVTVDASVGDQQFQRPENMYKYYSMLHKTPSGPNPIGNEYRPTSTNDDVKKNRYPPQG